MEKSEIIEALNNAKEVAYKEVTGEKLAKAVTEILGDNVQMSVTEGVTLAMGLSKNYSDKLLEETLTQLFKSE